MNRRERENRTGISSVTSIAALAQLRLLIPPTNYLSSDLVKNIRIPRIFVLPHFCGAIGGGIKLLVYKE
jgi:hypothetical protein